MGRWTASTWAARTRPLFTVPRSAGASGCATPTWRSACEGRDRDELFSTSLAELEAVLASMDEPDDQHAADARTVALHRLGFLRCRRARLPRS